MSDQFLPSKCDGTCCDHCLPYPCPIQSMTKHEFVAKYMSPPDSNPEGAAIDLEILAMYEKLEKL